MRKNRGKTRWTSEKTDNDGFIKSKLITTYSSKKGDGNIDRRFVFCTKKERNAPLRVYNDCIFRILSLSLYQSKINNKKKKEEHVEDEGLDGDL